MNMHLRIFALLAGISTASQAIADIFIARQHAAIGGTLNYASDGRQSCSPTTVGGARNVMNVVVNNSAKPIDVLICKRNKQSIPNGVALSRQFIPLHIAPNSRQTAFCAYSGGNWADYYVAWADFSAPAAIPSDLTNAANALTVTSVGSPPRLTYFLQNNSTTKSILVSYKLGAFQQNGVEIKPLGSVALGPNISIQSAQYENPYHGAPTWDCNTFPDVNANHPIARKRKHGSY